MTAGKGRLVNDGHIKGQLVNDGHSKGQLVNDGHSKGQLVNDGHKFDSFWGHSPTFTALYSSCPTQIRIVPLPHPTARPPQLPGSPDHPNQPKQDCKTTAFRCYHCIAENYFLLSRKSEAEHQGCLVKCLVSTVSSCKTLLV